jgi:spore maturation protein B
MSWALPLMLLAGVVYSFFKGVKTYDEFAAGAMDGLRAILSAAPNICAAVICIGLFRRCGLMDLAAGAFAGVFEALGMPGEIMPLVLLRPLSGGASLSLLQQLFEQHGPDSYIARTAASLMGSTETVFYTMAVYLSGVKSKGSGWAVAVALTSCLAGGIFAAWVCRLL